MKYLKIIFLPTLICILIAGILVIFVDPVYHWLLILIPFIFVGSVMRAIIRAILDKIYKRKPGDFINPGRNFPFR